MEAHRQCCLHGGSLSAHSSRFGSVPVLPRTRHKVGLARATAPPAQQEQPPEPAYMEDRQRISQYVRPEKKTYADPPITSTGSLRPGPEWFPAWMRYRRREDNYVFWEDKFSRNSMDIAYDERRWTLFSTVWYLVMQLRFRAIPPALRYVFYLGWRRVMTMAYQVHKLVILWQCKLEADLASQALGLTPRQPIPLLPSVQNTSSNSTSPPSSPSSPSPASVGASAPQPDAAVEAPGGGEASTSTSEAGASSVGTASTTSVQAPRFSRTMALRRLHWKNTLLAEIMYVINVYKTGRVHMLPPKKKPLQRPTFFWLF